jgi:hypothetical protein
MTEVGAPRNASIRSGAGFGTLVMAVVMLMRIVSPYAWPHLSRPPEFFPCGKTNSIPQEQL